MAMTRVRARSTHESNPEMRHEVQRLAHSFHIHFEIECSEAANV